MPVNPSGLPRREVNNVAGAGGGRRDPLGEAARAIAGADALLIAAGAGMGVDSGLPDFRGPEGFWRAYPSYRALGLRFEALAQPRWFEADPALAWGFYGHRLGLYRAATPHAGFSILRRWVEAKARGAFVFTSNVDGQFERAGFDPAQVHECHGSLLHAQCLRACGAGVFAADFEVAVDPVTFRARPPLPTCPRCGALARPNVLMFDDWAWDDARASASGARLERWLEDAAGGQIAVVEIGAGTRVPSVRRFAERVARALPAATLVRINLREAEAPAGAIPLQGGALEVLRALDERLG